MIDWVGPRIRTVPVIVRACVDGAEFGTSASVLVTCSGDSAIVVSVATDGERQRDALARLPRAYSLALRLRAARAPDDLIADYLDIDIVALETLFADRPSEARGHT